MEFESVAARGSFGSSLGRDHRSAGRAEDELRRVRAELREREQLCQQLEGLLESLSDGIVALDFEGSVMHLSDGLREGAESFDPEVEPLPARVHEQLARVARKLSPGRPQRFEMAWDRSDLGPRHYRVVAAKSEQEPSAGESPLVLFALHDQTREQSLEAELAGARDLAALGQMAATVAHELRNPLAAIQGFTTLLRRDVAGQNDAVAQTDRILEGVAAANRIISDLLEYCRPIQLRREPVSAESLLAESLLFVRAGAKWRPEVDVDLAVEPGLAPLAIDRRLIRQALVNVLENAADAMNGSGAVSIRVRPLGDPIPGDMLRILIRDSGPGLSAEQAARVFEPFYTTKEKGTGLGLAIVRRTIEAHGGRVHLVSSPGRGTSLVIDLPAGAAALREAGQGNSQGRTESPVLESGVEKEAA